MPEVVCVCVYASTHIHIHVYLKVCDMYRCLFAVFVRMQKRSDATYDALMPAIFSKRIQQSVRPRHAIRSSTHTTLI